MAESKVHQYKVTMTCDGCCGAVRKVLGKLEGSGVDKFEVSLADQIVKVTSSLPADKILEVLKKTGKEVEYLSSA